jgi:epoxyqueuosine reductase
MIDPTRLKTELLNAAAVLGFDACGVTGADSIDPAADRLRAFIRDGRHGDMDWLAKHEARRASPQALWPEVRSIVMLGTTYAPAADPLAALVDKKRGAISVYAQGQDYHDVIKTRLKQLARVLTDAGAQARVFVDTAPLMEKPLAQASGLGWQGRHTNLVSRTHGSWLFLGAVLTTAELPFDAPEVDHCGSCHRCLDVCPTAAFPAPYQLDARRCLAYLSIEHKGHIALEFRQPMANRIFGCDDCLAVCPWNKFAEQTRDIRLQTRIETDNPPLSALLTLDDASFRQQFAGTPIKRTGRDRFIRNCLIAAGNSGDQTLVPLIARLTGDGSPLVRAMSAWALSLLCSGGEFEVLRAANMPFETDEAVLAEWRRADHG